MKKLFFLSAFLVAACIGMGQTKKYPVTKTDAEWRKQLTAEQFQVTRQKGTERAFTGIYWDNHDKGIYKCICCGQELFSSATKFDSGTGWPSFWEPLPAAVGTKTDFKLFLPRTEYHCARCGGHQGHVFDDGPKPTGLRYCNNGLALQFVPRGDKLPALRT